MLLRELDIEASHGLFAFAGSYGLLVELVADAVEILAVAQPENWWKCIP